MIENTFARGRPVLVVSGLTVSLASGVSIIEDVALELAEGKILGLVGESGSGKSTLARALLGYTPSGTHISAGSVTICGEASVGRTEKEFRELRRRLVSYVPQDPGTSLNPSMRVGEQIADRVGRRRGSSRLELVRRACVRAQLPSDDSFLRRFPHQLSGGQRQRVMIAAAVATNPPLVVLDEPTTGLDVVTQSAILEQIRELRRSLGVSLVYVSHDMAAIAAISDDIAVMYAGRIIEFGPTADVLGRPRHPYTKGLVESTPEPATALRLDGIPGVAVGVGEWPPGCAFEPRCAIAMEECRSQIPPQTTIAENHYVRCLRWRITNRPQRATRSPVPATRVAPDVVSVVSLTAGHRSREGEVIAARDISFVVHEGECLALVGESGSGKTTIARCIAGLHRPSTGDILLHGRRLEYLAAERDLDARRRVQIIFQNPYESLNPRHTVARTIIRPAQLLGGLTPSEARSEMYRSLERVRLPSRTAGRFPTELSGGERQRVAIARALVANPEMLICDEITSSLDVSVQGVVLNLLRDLRAELGLAMLFISHDLGVVASVADRVLILHHGAICESGTVGEVLNRPSDDYTRQLLEAAPRLSSSYEFA